MVSIILATGEQYTT